LANVQLIETRMASPHALQDESCAPIHAGRRAAFIWILRYDDVGCVKG